MVRCAIADKHMNFDPKNTNLSVTSFTSCSETFLPSINMLDIRLAPIYFSWLLTCNV